MHSDCNFFRVTPGSKEVVTQLLTPLCEGDASALLWSCSERSPPICQYRKGRALIPPRHLFASHRLQIPGLIFFSVEHLTCL